MVIALAATSGIKDVPLVFGCNGTFDKKTFRYVTDAEAHLQRLIDREPERAFLWVRLGNLYSHSGQNDRAEAAYQRALELDPQDIEAHSMLGQVLCDTNRLLEGVPHWHTILKHARDAQDLSMELRRNLVRGAIESLLDARAQSNGQIELFPKPDPAELNKVRPDESVTLVLRDFDLGTEKGINDLCDTFLEQPRRPGRDLFPCRRNQPNHVHRASDDRPVVPINPEQIHRDALHVGRNDPCPCGSGRKYKKCCGR